MQNPLLSLIGRRRSLYTRMLGMTLCGVIVFVAYRIAIEPGRAQSTVKAASSSYFTPDGNLKLPETFRRWEHVGTRVKTSGRSVLDGSVIVTPQMMDTYVEPSAFAAFKATGRWPDGTLIVKELSLIKVGQDCHKITFACSTPAGVGIFEDHFIGVGMMVKDSRRFPDAPGHWAYFRFLGNGSTYPSTSAILPPDQCQSCHVRFAAKEDYVFTDTHIGLTSPNVH